MSAILTTVKGGDNGSGTVTIRHFNIPPLHAAAMRGDVAALSALCSSGTLSVDTRDAAGRTALHLASMAGQVQACIALLDHHCYVDAIDALGCTSLHVAAGQGHTLIVETLIARHASVDARANGGWTPVAAPKPVKLLVYK